MVLYEAARTNPAELIACLQQFEKLENEHGQGARDFFYSLRNLHNTEKNLQPTTKAAIQLFLLARSYGSLLYRDNTFGPTYGGKKGSDICKRIKTLASSGILNDFNYSCCDYEEVLAQTTEFDLVFLDPPYDTYTRFYMEGDIFQQLDLMKECDELTSRNIKFILINSNTLHVRQLYDGYLMFEISRPSKLTKKTNQFRSRKAILFQRLRNSVCLHDN